MLKDQQKCLNHNFMQIFNDDGIILDDNEKEVFEHLFGLEKLYNQTKEDRLILSKREEDSNKVRIVRTRA